MNMDLDLSPDRLYIFCGFGVDLHLVTCFEFLRNFRVSFETTESRQITAFGSSGL